VDLWHLLEKVGKALRERFDGQRASAELHRWKMRLLNRSEAWRKLLAEVCSWGLDRGAGRECVVHDAVTFLENQGEAGRLDYTRAREQGRLVGSGVVEATCKSLFNVRLKRGGARWREARAGRLMRWRALALSGRWAPAMAHLRGKVAVEVRRAARAGWPADPADPCRPNGVGSSGHSVPSRILALALWYLRAVVSGVTGGCQGIVAPAPLTAEREGAKFSLAQTRGTTKPKR